MHIHENNAPAVLLKLQIALRIICLSYVIAENIFEGALMSVAHESDESYLIW